MKIIEVLAYSKRFTSDSSFYSSFLLVYESTDAALASFEGKGWDKCWARVVGEIDDVIAPRLVKEGSSRFIGPPVFPTGETLEALLAQFPETETKPKPKRILELQ